MVIKNKLLTEFPHIIRKINAEPLARPFDYFFWYLLICLILINLLHSHLFPFDTEKRLQRRIVQIPFESTFHEQLGQYYLSLNMKAAEGEYFLAEELYQNAHGTKTNVLGVQSSPADIFKNVKSKQQSTENELKQWEFVYNNFPDFIYAKKKMAILHYQLGNKEKSGEYLKSVLSESPSDQTLVNLTEQLK